MKASDKLNEETRKKAYGEYVKEKNEKKAGYYLTFEVFVQKRYIDTQNKEDE